VTIVNDADRGSWAFRLALMRADAMEHGEEQRLAVRQLLEQAIEDGDPDRIFEARQLMVEAANFSNHVDESMVEFAALLAQIDAEPHRETYHTLWKYKWILGDALRIPEIPLDRIAAMAADFERRLLAGGYSLRPLFSLRADIARETNDRRGEAALWKKFRATARDGMSNCYACEVDAEAEYRLHVGKLDESLEIARPILNRSVGCSSVPHRTFGRLLTPLLLADRTERALELYRTVIRLSRGKDQHVSSMVDCVEFQILTDNLAVAGRCLDSLWPVILRQHDPRSRFHFHRVAALAAKAAQAQKAGGGAKEIRLRPPSELQLPTTTGKAPLADLADHFRTRAEEVAARFDNRSNKPLLHDRLSRTLRLVRRIRPVPLK
jgi:hypothetical protein